jgi:protein O-GlcNAc transferase
MAADFAAKKVDAADHIVVTPPIPAGKFPALLNLADVYLDSVAWSGGNTSLEAATAELPMVTMPGRFMRGRHTAAVLTTLGLEDFIAKDATGYVDLAVRLGKNPRLRRQARVRIGAAKERLFNDLTPVRALEAFLEKGVRP